MVTLNLVGGVKQIIHRSTIWNVVITNLLFIICYLYLQETMQDPVVAMDGYTYERYAIEAHMLKTPLPALPLSPMSGEPLSSRMLLSNRLAHDLIAHLYVDEVRW